MTAKTPAIPAAKPFRIESAPRDAPTVSSCSYFTLAGSEIPTSPALRAFLGERLPAHMLPSAFVLLEALPLTPNGKIDRKALPLPEQESLPPGEDFIAPRTPTEAQVAAIWSDLLGVAQISVQENFFALGGHSLLAVRVLLRVQERFQVELPLSTLFEAPTVAELALKLVQVQAEQVDDDLLSQLLDELEETPDAEVHDLLAVEQRTDQGGS